MIKYFQKSFTKVEKTAFKLRYTSPSTATTVKDDKSKWTACHTQTNGKVFLASITELEDLRFFFRTL